MKKMAKRLNRSLSGDVFIAVILAFLGSFMILPLIYTVSQSLKPFDELWTFPPAFLVKNPTFKNFTSLFNLMSYSWIPFSRYFFNTLFVSVVGTFGHVVLASLAAFALSKHRFPGQKFIFKMIVLSLMFSAAVTAVPSFLILSKLKLMNTLWVLILPAFSTPIGLYLMKQFMEQMIPDSILESARLDGASEWMLFSRIAMPIVKPAWLTLIVFSFQGLWGIGQNTLIQREDLKTLNYALSQILAAGIARAGSAAAATVVMMILPVLVFIITQSNIVETMASSGMKD